MYDERKSGRDISGIMPWTPPAGYENPVPEGDRDGSTLAAKLLIAVVVLGVIAAILWPTIESAYESGSDFIDDVDQFIQETRDSLETSSSQPAAPDLVASGLAIQVKL